MEKSISEKFNWVVKHGFHEVLKPMAFKKKGNNFYRPLEDIGHLVSIQKSSWNT